MITLDLADLVVIASQTLRLDTGEVLDLLDPAAAERALALIRPGSGPGDPAGLAATLLRALVRERPLRRGNHQVALAAMFQFLALNGWDVEPDPPGRVATVVAELAAGLLEVRQVADWLTPRLRPRDRAGASTKDEQVQRASALLLAGRLKRVTLRMQPTGKLRRFTEQGRRAVQLAQEEALLLGHDYVGTEHLLLGLLYEGAGVAANALESAGVGLEDVRGRVGETARRAPAACADHIAFTARAKKVLELSLREALALGHLYIGTEHLLLALLREGEGTAAQVLTGLGAGQAQLRDRVLSLLAGEYEQEDIRPVAELPDAAGQLAQARLDQADLLDAAERLAQVRQDKAAAFGAGDLEAAAALRDREKQLLADKLRLEQQLRGPGGPDLAAENRRLRRELQRLRDLLRRHGIEPDDGPAQTA